MQRLRMVMMTSSKKLHMVVYKEPGLPVFWSVSSPPLSEAGLSSKAFKCNQVITKDFIIGLLQNECVLSCCRYTGNWGHGT